MCAIVACSTACNDRPAGDDGGGSSTGADESSSTGGIGGSTTEPAGSTGESASGTSVSTGEPTSGSTSDPSAGENTDGSTTDSGTGSESSGDGGTTGALLPESWGFFGGSTADEVRAFDISNTLPGPAFDVQAYSDYPYDLTITPDGSQVWVVGQLGNGFTVIDALAPAQVHAAALAGEFPTNVAFDSTRAFISTMTTASVVVVDRSSFEELEIIPTPDALPAGKGTMNACFPHLHVVQWGGPGLMTYDVEDGTWETVALPQGSQLWDLAVHPAGNRLYAIDQGLSQVHVFDLVDGIPVLPLVTSIDVSAEPWAIDITSDGQTLVVTCDEGDAVHLIDAETFANTTIALPTDAESWSVDIDVNDEFAYVGTGTLPSVGDGAFRVNLQTQEIELVGLGRNNASLVAVAPQASVCAAP